MMSRRDMVQIVRHTRRKFRRDQRRGCIDHLPDYIGRVHDMYRRLGVNSLSFERPKSRA